MRAGVLIVGLTFALARTIAAASSPTTADPWEITKNEHGLEGERCFAVKPKSRGPTGIDRCTLAGCGEPVLIGIEQRGKIKNKIFGCDIQNAASITATPTLKILKRKKKKPFVCGKDDFNLPKGSKLTLDEFCEEKGCGKSRKRAFKIRGGDYICLDKNPPAPTPYIRKPCSERTTQARNFRESLCSPDCGKPIKLREERAHRGNWVDVYGCTGKNETIS